jgi:hypothetical protein
MLWQGLPGLALLGKCQCTGSYTSTREEIFRAPKVILPCILTAVSALTRYSVVPSSQTAPVVTCIHSLNLRKIRIPRDMRTQYHIM